jgi:hypothetical protein
VITFDILNEYQVEKAETASAWFASRARTRKYHILFVASTGLQVLTTSQGEVCLFAVLNRFDVSISTWYSIGPLSGSVEAFHDTPAEHAEEHTRGGVTKSVGAEGGVDMKNMLSAEVPDNDLTR